MPQTTLGKVLREHAATLLDVTMRIVVTFVSAGQDGHGVTAVLRDGSGEERTASGRDLVGADGARNAVRELIGAKMERRHRLSRNDNVVFRVQAWRKRIPHGRVVTYRQVDRHRASLIGSRLVAGSRAGH